MLRTTLKSLRAHWLRLLLTGLSVMIGVAFVSGTFVFTDTINATFDNLFADSFAGTDVVVQAEAEFAPGFTGPPPVDESLLDLVRSVDGVAVAEGSVFGFAQLVDKEGNAIAPTGPPTLGGSWAQDPRLDGSVELREGRRPTAAGEITVDARTAQDNDLAVGDVVDVLVPTGRIEGEIVGVVGFGESDNLAGATFTGFELTEAQRVLGLEGKFSAITAVADEGLSPEALRDRVALVVPDGIEAVTAADEAAEQSEALKDALGFIGTVILVFAAVAVFVAAFIIQNTFRIIVAQRTREMALLRAVGATGAQVVRMVVVEALIVGVVASAIGLAVGFFVAVGLQGLMSAAGFDLPSTALELAPRTILIGMAVGVLVTVAAAILPARRAARIPPVAALTGVAAQRTGSLGKRAQLGALTLAAGIALVLVGLFEPVDVGVNPLLVVGLGGLVTFVGVSVLSVLVVEPVARLVAAPILALGKVSGRLARDNAIRRPRRTAATASALMIGLALVGFFFILGASIKATTGAAIESTLRADYVITVEGFSGGLPPAFAGELAELPEVGAVTPLRLNFWNRDGSDEILVGIDAATADDTIFLDVQDGSLAALAGGGVFVFDDTAANEGWEVGDTIPMGFAATGLQQVPVVGTFAERNALPQGSPFLVGLDFYEQNFSEQLDFAIGLRVGGDADPGAARAAIEALADRYPSAVVEDQAEFRESQEGQVDVLLNLFNGLLLLAVIIALFGITNTLVLSVYERTREIGLLRAVGMSRWQVRRMVLWESIVVAVMGGLLGAVVGVFFGIVVVAALGRFGVDVLAIPYGDIASLVVFAAVVGVLASIFPARRAARTDILEAIATE